MVTVNLRNDLTPVATRPTLKNPDISVVVGQAPDGSYHPKEIIYPDSMSKQDVDSKVRRFNADHQKKPCPVCQRYKQEIENQRRNNMYYNSKNVAGVAVPPVTTVGGVSQPLPPIMTYNSGITGAQEFLMKKPIMGIPIVAFIAVAAVAGVLIYLKKKKKI